MNLRDKLKFWIMLSNYVDMIVRGTSPLSLPDAIADSLSYVKAFGGTEQRDIPDNYLQRQFIYMMDGSYLLTDIVPTYDGRIEMDFQTTSVQSGATSYLGGRSDSYPAGLRLGTGSGNSRFVVTAFSDSAYTATTVSVQNNTRYKFTFNNKVATLESGGSTLFTNTFAGENANGAALVINGLNSAGTVTANLEGIYLYSFKAWDNQGNLIADYVPAVQKGTVPVVGFYDTVSKTFKTATAGTFAAGGEAVPTPDTPMDIISNNGVLKVSPNLFNSSDITTTTVSDVTISVDSDGVITADGTSSSPNYSQFVFPLSNPISEGTYTVSLYNSEALSAGSLVGFAINTTVGTRGTGLTTVNSVKTITVGSGEVCNNVIIRIAGTADQFKFKIQIEKGDQGTTYRPYGQIYTDGTVETINVHGKNLFNVSANPLEQGGIASNDGQNTIASYNQRVRTNGYIPVKPNTVYTASVKDLQIYYLEYAQDKTYTDRHATGFSDNRVTITTGANTYFVRLQFRKSDNSNIQPSEVTNVQLERGSTATTYAPYYDGGTATAEMLLKLGDYQDVQSIIDGVVTRNVGIKVLDGTETWSYAATYSRFVTNVSDMPVATARTLPFITTHYQVTYGATTDPGYIYNSGQRQIMIVDAHTSVEDWTQWLADQYAAGRPVIVLYPLDESTTESVAGQTLQVTDGDNVLEITQASLNNLELEASYKRAA